MDLYILDEFLRRTAVVDQYESLIWTDRYAAYGDFELVIRSDRGIRALFSVGTRLAILSSWHVMVVETLENGFSDDGFATLTVSGRSLETILMSRITRRVGVVEGTRTWTDDGVTTGTPGDIMRGARQYMLPDPTFGQDAIPYMQPGTLLPLGTIPEPTSVVTFRFNPITAYEFVKTMADTYTLGFRIVRNGDASQLYYEVYTGNDRTTLQTANRVVVFSSELDNLSDTKELTSTADVYNVAYVFGKNGCRIVYADGVDSTISGFDRRVLSVDASSIDLPAGSALQAALEQRGKEELAKHRPLVAFDGEIPQSGSYLYGRDYGLGDLVEMRNADGLATNMRVTEHIFVSDREGQRAYPTLSADLVITPGSWYAWTSGEVWDQAEGYWADA